MANTQVTLKVTPHELQIISEALEMYGHYNRHLGRDNEAHPLVGYKQDLSIVDNDPRRAAGIATMIRQNIGLK